MNIEPTNEQDNEQEKKRRKRDVVWDHVDGAEDEDVCWCKHCPHKWKVDTIRLHFGIDKNGYRLPGKGSCRKNPYASTGSPGSVTSHLVAAMSPALQKKFREEMACLIATRLHFMSIRATWDLA